ncbi:MAG: hypothetical protein MR355_04000 [Lachnospiraceae bacterium]|nr:hypothetical protein [Lachnospiraceae bacterium]
MDRKLPDTPWHVGYIKKEEDDPRRHKARCIHNVDGECRSTCSNYYRETCGGSSHCDDYSETVADYKKLLEERKTADEIERENIQKYKLSLLQKKKELTKTDNAYSHKTTKSIRRCLVCNEGLESVKYSLKKCLYCGMYYLNINDSTNPDILDIVKADEVFLMNVPRNHVPTQKQKGQQKFTIRHNSLCKYINKKNKCTKLECNKFAKRCAEVGCEFYKRTDD